MYRPGLQLRALVGVVLLAACSDHNGPTAPSARPLAAAVALADRPYTWSLTCQGNWGISASWSWTQNGTVIASGGAACSLNGQVSGTGVRPAIANGFTAQVGFNSQKSWTFDPAGPFKASLSGSTGGGGCPHHTFCWLKVKEDGKLTVDS